MKKVLLILFLLSFLPDAHSQSPEVLNKYRYVFVPQLFYNQNETDIYGIRAVTLDKLRKSGVPLFLDEQEMTKAVLKEPCTLLQCLVSNLPSGDRKNTSVVTIIFLDCKNDTVLKYSAHAELMPGLSETKKSFGVAADEALQDFNSYHYHFQEDTAVYAPAGVTGDDSILWNPERKLSWDDFKGPPRPDDPADALTFTCNATNFESFSAGNRFEFESDVACYFIRHRSWVKEGKQSPYLLNHEQRHFDLAEAGAREFSRRLKETTFTSKNFKDQLKTITDGINDKYDKLQKQYDSETDHSRVVEKQLEWNNKIDEMLKSR